MEELSLEKEFEFYKQYWAENIYIKPSRILNPDVIEFFKKTNERLKNDKY